MKGNLSHLIESVRSWKYLPRWGVLVIDLFITLFSFFLVYYLCLRPFSVNFISLFSLNYQSIGLFPDLLIVMLLQVISFICFRTYSGILRYSAYIDALKLLLSVAFTMASLFLVHGLSVIYNEFNPSFPPLFLTLEILLFSLLNFVFLFSVRLVVKLLFERLELESGPYKNVMIYGAKQAGVAIAKSLKMTPNKYNLVGFIDDDNNHVQLMGVKVYSFDKLESILAYKKVKAVIVSPLKMQEKNITKLLEFLLERGVQVLTTSILSEYNQGAKVDVRSIKNIQIEDLLERKEIKIDKQEISAQLKDKTILITGSAGSIGSEIVRQVARFEPKLIIVLDQSETALFDIKNEIKQTFENVRFVPFLADIRNLERMEYVVKTYRPDIIYHAAAYKHVPMLEDNPVEAVQTNVLGTKNMADLAVKYKVSKFVMISTDKAVNPANIMGASKRIAEIYVQSYFKKLQREGNVITNFITTRFGNVLGSNGSVIPIFKRQIEEGGPVKVTHPDIIRYFMTIPEACNLVLEASTIGKGGEIFIFDMGVPVKIDDLAKKMIRLAGYTPNVDIKVEYTGLRPGEKLYEELLNVKEITKETSHEKIMIANVQEYDYDVISKEINTLIGLSREFNDFPIVAKMKEIVPEFRSKNSVYESLDK